MARRTYGQALVEAMKADAEWGTQRHSDDVLCRMLGQVARKATPGTLAKASISEQGGALTRPPVKLLVKSFASKAAQSAAKKVAKPQRRTWSRAEVEQALDDGVRRGRISGSTAVVAMKAFEGKR